MSGPISTLFVIAVPTRRTTSPTSRLSVKSGMCSPCCSSAATGTTTGMSRDRLLTSGQVISCSSIMCLPFVLSLVGAGTHQSHGPPGSLPEPCQEPRGAQVSVSTRYLFAAVSSIVRSVRARAWHDRNQPDCLSSSGSTATEQRPCATCPAITRILHVPQPPPRQPNVTLAPEPRIAASTVSSAWHETMAPIGLKVIVYMRLAGSRLHSVSPRTAVPTLRVDAQKRLVQLLRIVEDGRADLVLRPPDSPTVRIHLIRGVPAEGLQAIA